MHRTFRAGWGQWSWEMIKGKDLWNFIVRLFLNKGLIHDWKGLNQEKCAGNDLDQK